MRKTSFKIKISRIDRKIKVKQHLTPEISENIWDSQIRSIEKRRTHSTNDNKSQSRKRKSIQQFQARRKSTETVNIIYINHILSQFSKTSLINDKYPSNVKNSIQLDEIHQNKQIHQLSKNDNNNNNKVRVKHIPSADRSTPNDELHHSLID